MARVFGIVGIMVGLHPLLARPATTSVGDYATLTSVIAASADGDTIILTNNITVSAEIAISGRSLTIQGNNYSVSVPVPGLDPSGIVNASPSAFRVFNISASGKTNTLQNLTILGGAPASAGGGIWNNGGTLVLQSVTIAQSGGPNYGGGGLDNSSGTVFMRDCNISRNAAKYGGGFLNAGTGVQLFLERCTFSENRSLDSSGGGGAGQNNNALYANNCTFANNKSTELGGAINNRTSTGIAYFVDCTFVGNVAYGTGFMGGAIANNGGAVTLVNSLSAYNYHFNGSTFDLNDINDYLGNAGFTAYYSVFQSTANQLGTSVGTTIYPGNISGSDNSLFCGGATALVLGPDGTPVGSTTIFQPFLAKVGSSQTPTAVLMPGSFALGKGARAAFASTQSPPVVGCYSGGSWVTLSGSSPASYETTTDQNGTARGGALTVGAVNSTATGLFMLKVNAAANGSVSGGTIYGDTYAAGTTVTLTAIPAAGYAFNQWNYVLGGTGVASTANPFAITLTTNVTLLPVFSLYTGFTVSYSGNGSTGGAVPAQQVVGSGGSTNLSGAGTMTRSGYAFASWNTRSDGNGTNYAPNAVYSGPGNLNLYARWTLIPSPGITTPPASQVAATNAPVTLNVSVTGTAPFYYQWFKNGGMIVNGTNSTLTFASAGVTNSGVYYVAVTNAYGLSISLPATVTVGAPQLLAWGWNNDGQLGDGTMVNKSLPESVLSNVVATASGENHSLYLKGDGTLWAMGENPYGQLGDGTITQRTSPVCVASNVVTIAAGAWHSLYLKNDGTVWTMGGNSSGQLGDGTTTDRHSAVCVASNTVALGAGFWHSLFLKSDGSLWVVGANGSGQLGDGTTTQHAAPESIASNVVLVASASWHSLYVKSDGTLWAVGGNGSGQLGDGTTIQRVTPESVASNVVAVMGGNAHSLYVKNDGTLWAMGDNSHGELGDGTTTSRSTAEIIASNVAAVTAGNIHSLYLKNDGSLWAMGDNTYGELGDGSTTQRNSPVPVPGMSLANVASGVSDGHTLALGLPLPPSILSQPTNQTVVATSNVNFTVAATGFAPLSYQWFFNGTNLLGGATAASYSLTVVLMTNAGSYTVVVSNSVGSVTSTVAVLTVNKATPTVSTWPTATPILLGQSLASSTLVGGSPSVSGTFAFNSPAAVPTVTGPQWVSFNPADPTDYYSISVTVGVTVLSPPSLTTSPTNQVVAVGGPVNLSVTPSGTGPFFFQWFKNGGMVAGATNSALTVASAGVTNSGSYYVVVTNAYGLSISLPATVAVGSPQLLVWGYNAYGQLGDGTTTDKQLPEALAGNIVIAAAGGEHSLYVKSDGTLWAAGYNNYGQLGDGTTISRSNAVAVASNVVAVAAGDSHSLYLKNDGTLWAMGYNTWGQLGDGTTISRSNAVPVASNVVAAAAGLSHSLFLKSDGTLWTMGYNNYGQLGDGTTTPHYLPESADTNVVAVTVGYYDSLYLKSDGTLWAMGYNNQGELGDGTTTSRSQAESVASNVVAAAGGGFHSLYLKKDGTLWGMGYNVFGQLGDGTTINRSNAVSVATNVVVMAAGLYHSHFLKADGTLWAMGYGYFGELGDGTGINQANPVPITGMSLASINSSEVAMHTLAVGVPLPPVITGQPTNQTVVATGNVTFTAAAGGFAPLTYQWYFNGTNLLSGATATNYTIAGAMMTNAGNYTVVVSNSGGSVTSSVAVLTVNKATPTVSPWPTATPILLGQSLASSTLVGGSPSVSGTFAFTTPATVPVATAPQWVSFTPTDTTDYYSIQVTVSVTVLSPPSVTTSPTNQVVAVGGPVNLSVTPAGTAPFHYQWFKNGGMVAGATNSALTVASAGVTNSGSYYVVVTNAYGLSISRPATITVGTPHLLVWGWNGYSQLGDGTTVNQCLPESVAGNVAVASAGADHSLLLKADGTLWGVGFNGDGELGDGTTVNRTAPVSVASNVVAVAGAVWHSLFVTSDGTLWAMGQNIYGQLGDGTTSSRSNAVSVASNVVAVAGGNDDSCFLKADGTLWAMGQNGNGQLGDGTTTDRHLPVFVASNVVAVSAGYVHTLFLKNDGTLWAAGYNGFGQLGDGTTTDRHSPVSIASNVVAVSAGYSHTLFLKSDGTLWAAGYNGLGQLGDGTTTDRHLPVPVASSVVAVTAGYSHSLFLKNDGSLWAMGFNGYGQLGDGSWTTRASPVPVPGLSLANVVSGALANHTLAVGVPLAPTVVGITMNNNGTVTATFQGVSGASYLVFASTNLVAPGSWSPVATNQVGAGGIWPYTEANTGLGQRFFRATVAP